MTFPVMLLLVGNSYAQRFLTDTVRIHFRSDSLIGMDCPCIKAVMDDRNEDPHFTMYQTKNKFLLFPVDQEIHTTKPLAMAIFNGLSGNDSCRRNYTLQIKRFEIEKKKERFSSSTWLTADIPVFINKNDSEYYYGTLFYDFAYHPLNKKERLPESAENLLNLWHTSFKVDLIKLDAIAGGSSTGPVPNLLTDPNVHSTYLYVQTGVLVGPGWFGFQGEVYFSRPEIYQRNRYVSGIVRYQNNREYESFAIGKKAQHFTYRSDKKLVYDIDVNILPGFLKWKHVKSEEPTLYQVFNIELSSIQSVFYNKQNISGFTARIGAIETLGYIIERDLKFRFGLFAGLGYKF